MQVVVNRAIAFRRRAYSSVLTLVLVMGLPSVAHSQAQDQSVQGPFLRIDAGMHSGRINATATDAQNNYVVTASDDKTVRVWSLPDGRPLKTLRGPIGPGHQGQYYAVAISPDGDTVAAGGWLFPPGSEENIYLFDRVSGAIRRRILGLPEVVDTLTYSRDGGLLVVGLGGKNGIRVYDASAGYRLIASDPDYDNSV